MSAAGSWTVQAGSFVERAHAERLARRLREAGFRVEVSARRVAGRMLYRVRAGEAGDYARMEALAARLRRAGHTAAVLIR